MNSHVMGATEGIKASEHEVKEGMENRCMHREGSKEFFHSKERKMQRAEYGYCRLSRKNQKKALRLEKC